MKPSSGLNCTGRVYGVSVWDGVKAWSRPLLHATILACKQIFMGTSVLLHTSPRIEAQGLAPGFILARYSYGRVLAGQSGTLQPGLISSPKFLFMLALLETPDLKCEPSK